MFLTSTALLLGFVHGLGADHLVAIAALSIGSRARTFDHADRLALLPLEEDRAEVPSPPTPTSLERKPSRP